MKARITLSSLAGHRIFAPSWSLSLILTFLALAVPARPQGPPPPAQSIADAARNAREHKSNSTTPPKIFTADDLAVQSSLPTAQAIPPESSPKQAEAPAPPQADCNNPDDEKTKAELQAAQEELDQIQRELSYDPKASSGGDVDMTNFKSGSSGLGLGSQALSQAQPLAPARVSAVVLEEKIASLKEALRVACDSPKNAGIQTRLYAAGKELKLLQQEYDLDRSSYYSKTNYAGDPAGKAKLDAQQQQIESLQSEIERLKDELPPPDTNQVPE